MNKNPNQSITLGSYEKLRFQIFDEYNTKISDLTSHSFKYSILDCNSMRVIKTINGVLVDGVFIVELKTADTKDLTVGQYFYQTTLILPDGVNQIRGIGNLQVTWSANI